MARLPLLSFEDVAGQSLSLTGPGRQDIMFSLHCFPGSARYFVFFKLGPNRAFECVINGIQWLDSYASSPSRCKLICDVWLRKKGGAILACLVEIDYSFVSNAGVARFANSGSVEPSTRDTIQEMVDNAATNLKRDLGPYPVTQSKLTS